MKSIQSMLDLSNRYAIITGSAGVLGSVMAEVLTEMGANVILIDQKESDLLRLSKSIKKHSNVKVDTRFCNLESKDERDSLVSSIKSDYSKIDILINNAAFVGSSNLEGWAVSYAEQSIETWRRAIEVNLTAPFHLVQSLTDQLKGSECASVINIGSIYGKYGPDWDLYKGTSMSNPAAYSVSKGGLFQLTRWLAATLAPNIRVNAISPGGIYRNQPEEFVNKYENKVPLKRMANPDDFRGALAYLTSDMSKYVTGQVISVDGGWGIK